MLFGNNRVSFDDYYIKTYNGNKTGVPLLAISFCAAYISFAAKVVRELMVEIWIVLTRFIKHATFLTASSLELVVLVYLFKRSVSLVKAARTRWNCLMAASFIRKSYYYPHC
jgi:hypothetical protein